MAEPGSNMATRDAAIARMTGGTRAPGEATAKMAGAFKGLRGGALTGRSLEEEQKLTYRPNRNRAAEREAQQDRYELRQRQLKRLQPPGGEKPTRFKYSVA